jgi:phage terminase large subunit-like protein
VSADVVAGVDIGLVDDASSVAVAWRPDEERIAVDAFVWSAHPESTADAHVPGGIIDLELVEDHLRDLHRRFNVVAIAYNRRFFERSAVLLEREGLRVAPLEQNSRAMADAYEEWHQAVLAGRVAHPDEPGPERACARHGGGAHRPRLEGVEAAPAPQDRRPRRVRDGALRAVA